MFCEYVGEVAAEEGRNQAARYHSPAASQAWCRNYVEDAKLNGRGDIFRIPL